MAAPALPPCPAALLDPRGAPLLGAFAGSHAAPDLGALARSGLAGRLRHLLRAKRWVYALAVSEEVLAAVAIVEAGYFSGGFAWAVDRRTGALVLEASAAGLPAAGRVAPRAGAGARLTARGLAASLEPEGRALALHVRAGGATVDAVLDPAGAPAAFTLVAPVPGAGLRATTKAAGLAVRGAVSAGGRTLSLDGGAGGVDFTAGVLARNTSWRWAFAPGRPGSGVPGFNLCEGFGVPPDDPGENAGFAGAPYRLPPVTFRIGGTRAPWSLSGPGLDLTFEPQGAHAEARNLGVVTTRFVQVAGTFTGWLPGPDGARLRVAGLPGVVEDHWARW